MSISYEVGPDRSVFAESENFVRLSDVILGREDGGGPERLFAILERSVPRHDDPSLLTQEELQRRREIVDQTWDQVRRWLWAHADKAVRAEAASLRGQGDVTALHLVCKLDNPPTEVIEGLVEAAPEVVSWVDAHGWLPLHYACVSGASTEVLRLLTSKFPESKLVQDNQGRTPLHFYVTRIADNPNVMATNVGILSDTGAAELPDCRGMLPMHYACAYGNHPAVLTVLENAYPEAISRKENNGRTPLHLTMSNAYRDASPGVLNFLLQHESHDSSNMRDNEGNSPLHLLKLGIKNQKNVEEFEKHMHNFAECLKLYLASSPELSPDFLASLQALPHWLQEVAVVSPHVRDILNEKIIQRFPTSILMLDGYMLICIIVCFEIATIQSIDKRFSEHFDEDPIVAWALLIVGASYFFLREFIQVVALWSMGSLSSWFYDTTNWLDMTVIFLTFYYSILMIMESPAVMSKEAFRAGCAFTKGVLWMAVIFFLKSTQVDFAVFLGGVFYVVQRLVAFLLAVGVILLAFAQMFFLAYLQEEVCPQVKTDDGCEFPHCEFKTSLLKVYTMMMGEIGSVSRYDDNLLAQILYVAYAFLVVILLSNVLIAIVTDSYEIIQNDRAAIVFWSNRLDFVAEMDGISNVVRQRIFCIKDKERGAPGAPTRVQEGPSGTRILDSERSGHVSPDMSRNVWKAIIGLFEPNHYDVEMSPGNLAFWFNLIFQGIAVVIILVWIVLGFVSVGILWPPQVREYLFAQQETKVSRAEIERAKLGQLREIQAEMKALRRDIRTEMSSDREDMMRMKNEVESIQIDVLSDLQQVKELMTTLLSMGGQEQ